MSMASVNPLPQTLSGRLLRTVSQLPEKVLLSDARMSITAADLLCWADGVARAVAEATEQPRVGVLLPTDATFGPAFYGCQLAGRAVIPLSQILKPADLRWALTDSGVDTVITTGTVAALLDGWDGRRINIEQISQIQPDAIIDKPGFQSNFCGCSDFRLEVFIEIFIRHCQHR